MDPFDLTRLPVGVQSRAITFENPTGARGSGGTAAAGRKGAPSRLVDPGERVTLAEIDGPGVVRHLWLTIPAGPPEQLRSKLLEVFYDGSHEPSVSVPFVDLCGAPFGRPMHLDTALTTISEGRGFNLWMAMPFREHIRIDVVNLHDTPTDLYFQVDYTLEELVEPVGLLHATYRRENPTVMKQDFVIASGIEGPGRFLGCVVGVRVLEHGLWYGEGEVKVYLDGDTEHPTICGTGLEDYVGTGWGMYVHQGRYIGAPLDVREPGRPFVLSPDFVGFYRWHLPDPIVFERDLTVTIQQIGNNVYFPGEEDRIAASTPAGDGYQFDPSPAIRAVGIAERVDDYCAVAVVYAERAQPVPRPTIDSLVADIARLGYERPSVHEALSLF